MKLFLRLTLGFALASPAAWANPNDPAAQIASFQIAEGFDVNLFASEIEGIVKPIQMRWDERGRLWVIGSRTYPQIKPGEEPDDRVVIVEDTDGDGRADRSTVFADGLMIPTGIEIAGRDAIYLGEGSKLWLMRDTDGDGRADIREVVLRGFGTGDNHQNINSFRWSPSGELMFSQGLHAFSRIETLWGISRLDEAGLWRFRPREARLDGFFGGKADPQNPWGWIWTRTGQPLIVAGNNGSMFYPVPEMIRGWQNGRRDSIWDGRGRKTSGPEFIESAHFPDEWQGAMVSGGYINNALWTVKVGDDGAGFRIVDHPELPHLIRSKHGSFRPVDVRLGPDGALYVCDWYNPIIGHYQASFRHPERDRDHGRIWRITAKGRKLLKPPPILAESAPEPAALLAVLRGRDRWPREQALRLLFQGDSHRVTSAVETWVARLDPLAPDHDLVLLDALGILEAHETVHVSILRQALRAATPDVRAFAAGSISRWADRLPPEFDGLEALADLAHDDHPRVRLAAIVAAGNIPRPESIIVVLSAGDLGRDKFIETAMRAAVNVLQPFWSALDRSNWKPSWTETLTTFAAPARPATPANQTTAALPPAKTAAALPAYGTLRATPDFVSKLADEVRAHGDKRRGLAIYNRADLACIACHRIGDEGGILGPALDSIGSAQPLDFIIGAVLEPQREVKEGFETFQFTMKDGRVIAGIVVAGSVQEPIVRDPAGLEHRLSAAQIAGRTMLGSLMPAGLIDRLSREELRDLFAYLTSLGKPD
jgi:putative heme-binding domain-containing protein